MTTYMMGQPVVHTDIPLPEERGSGHLWVEVYKTARKLKVGHCMDIAYTRQPIASNLARQTGYRFTQRKVGDLLRIWRTE
mgnify:CR=1 FL=1